MSVAALGTKLSVWAALDQRGFEWNLTAQWEVGFDDSQSLMFWDRTRAEYSLCRLHSISLCVLPLISQPFDNKTLSPDQLYTCQGRRHRDGPISSERSPALGHSQP